MRTRRNILAIVALCSLFMTASLEAREPARPLAELAVGASRIDWQPAGDTGRLVLTVAGPESFWLRKEFEAGQPAFLSLSDQGRFPDGAYTYELRTASGRAQSGHFSIQDGSFVTAPAKPPLRNVTANLTDDELIIQGNACIGEECTTSDDDFPVLRLKGQNPNILFDDVEGPPSLLSSSFNDWAIRINASDVAKFSIFDVDGELTPFSILGGAPDDSLFIRDNGYVGLGTSTPGAKLHLFATATSDVFGSAGPDPVSGPAFNFGYGGTSYGRGAGFLNVRPDALATAPNPSLRFGTANVERMIISNTGDVGIGTSAPSARLDVKVNSAGAVARIHNLNASGWSGIEYLDNAGNVDLFFGVDNAASTARLNSVNNNPIVILTNFVERMRVSTAGDVGIGTATPSSKLHVNGGDIRVSGGSFIDDGTTLNVPDYVFEPHYRLMPLDELREFVSREKHLPNVPSASDVEKEGLNLSQIQMQLLEKLEELTLYTLKQDEQIKAQQARIDELQSALDARLRALEETAAAQPERQP